VHRSAASALWTTALTVWAVLLGGLLEAFAPVGEPVERK
jgi:hypothetical protein